MLGTWVQSLVRELRSHMLQLRAYTLQLEVLMTQWRSHVPQLRPGTAKEIKKNLKNRIETPSCFFFCCCCFCYRGIDYASFRNQARFRKVRGTRDQIANICWIIKKSKRIPEKHLLVLYWLHQSLWLCGSQQTGKYFERWEYLTTLSASWEICMQVKKQQLELDMEQWTGTKFGKEYVKGKYCYSAYLTFF